jgi:hypothetical protein
MCLAGIGGFPRTYLRFIFYSEASYFDKINFDYYDDELFYSI